MNKDNGSLLNAEAVVKIVLAVGICELIIRGTL